MELSVIIDCDDDDALLQLEEKIRGEAAGERLVEIIPVHGAKDSLARRYSDGFNQSSGKYVCFIEASGKYSEGTIARFLALEKKEDLLYCVRPAFHNPKGKKVYYLSKKYKGMIDLNRTPQFVNLCLGSYFLPRKFITEGFFKEGLTKESLLYGLIGLLGKERRYFYLPGDAYIFKTAAFDGYNYPEQFHKEWYAETIDKEFRLLLENNAGSRIVQHCLYYLLTVRFLCNWNTRDNGILNEQELAVFFASVKEFLLKIDDDIIIQGVQFGPEKLETAMRFHLLSYKYQNDPARIKHAYSPDKHVATFNNTIISLGENSLYLTDINYKNGELVFDGKLENSYFMDKNKLKVYVYINEKRIDAVPNNIYSLSKYFGMSASKAYTFQIKINESLFEDGCSIRAYYSHDGNEYSIPFGFGKIYSRINSVIRNSYWKFGSWIMQCAKEKGKQIIKIKKADVKAHAAAELKLLFSYFVSLLKEKDLLAGRALYLRILYWLTRPYFARRYIWVTYDQLFKGGDNGEYFFRYVADHADDDKVLPYYIINRSAPEYPGLKKKYGRNILEFQSMRCKLMALHADLIFATRVGVYQSFGISGKFEKLVGDLCNAHIICLQHGLTIQRIAQYQNRLFDNTQAYFLVSPLEKENIMHEAYGYSEGMLYETGAPRYDGLVSKDARQILIAPTWRRSVTAGTNTRGSMHEYSQNFKSTEYYRIYNRLINDKRLMEEAEKTGYSLIYVIHPILSPQINDFECKSHVRIVPGSEVNYEQILSESSLMITDYSGIQFDFAYMRKPVVYYHPDSLPPQYDSSVYDYPSKGLGPVCRNHDDLIETILNYMKNNCKIDQAYKQRIDSFFYFNDRNNCKRAYDSAVKYMKGNLTLTR